MRQDSVLPGDAHAQAEWIVVPVEDVISINAAIGRNFRFVLDRHAELRIDGGKSGAEVRVRVQQDVVGGWILRPNDGVKMKYATPRKFPSRKDANAVTNLVFRYDDGANVWEHVSVLENEPGPPIPNATNAANVVVRFNLLLARLRELSVVDEP